jgi:hypothetical protein
MMNEFAVSVEDEMNSIFKALSLVGLIGASLAPLPALAAGDATARVKVKGELVDTWCSVTGIMFAAGTAHHQCAVWCAAGGIPVSIKDKAGNYFMVLRIADNDSSVANKPFVKIQSHEVQVDGELIERDGVKYLFVNTVLDDAGVVDLTHDENGVVPFGN